MGRKVIVVITDGVDQGSRLSINQAVEAAQKSDAVIYCIDYYDPRRTAAASEFGWAAAAEAPAQDVRRDRRPRYKVDRKHTLEQVFKELQDEMRSQYSIAYTPANERKDGTYRKIEIKLSNKDLKAQARKGYYAIKPETR